MTTYTHLLPGASRIAPRPASKPNESSYGTIPMTTHNIQPLHISLIRPGDVVEWEGKLRTVGRADIKHGTFMGSSLWGDSFRCGTVPVQLVVFQVTKPLSAPKE